MEDTLYAQKILEMHQADTALRDSLIHKKILSEGYNEEMKKLHNHHAEILFTLIEEKGYPTSQKLGKEAAEAAWILILHSIGKPNYMRKWAVLLEMEVKNHRASPKELAYLTDRIAVLEGKPQSYGTQFDWDEKGELSPQPFDDLIQVNERRHSIGLNSLQAQTEIIRKRAQVENQEPPKNYSKRKHEMQQWRKQVGWIA